MYVANDLALFITGLITGVGLCYLTIQFYCLRLSEDLINLKRSILNLGDKVEQYNFKEQNEADWWKNPERNEE